MSIHNLVECDRAHRHRMPGRFHECGDSIRGLPGRLRQRHDVRPGFKRESRDLRRARRVAEGVPGEHREAGSAGSPGIRCAESPGRQHDGAHADEHQEEHHERRREPSGSAAEHGQQRQDDGADQGDAGGEPAQRNRLRDERGVLQSEQLRPGDDQQRARDQKDQRGGKETSEHGAASIAAPARRAR